MVLESRVKGCGWIPRWVVAVERLQACDAARGAQRIVEPASLRPTAPHYTARASTSGRAVSRRVLWLVRWLAFG